MDNGAMDIAKHRTLPPAGQLRLTLIDGNIRAVDANGKQYRLRAEQGVPVHADYATGTLTGTTIAADDTVTIGGVTYTFVAALSVGPAVAYEVLVGASDSDSLDNLIAAINGGAGEGTLYGTGTDANPFASAAAGAGDTMDLTALIIGPGGNGIGTTAALTAGGFGAATLEGGAFATEAAKGDVLFDIGIQQLYIASTDISKTSTSGWWQALIEVMP